MAFDCVGAETSEYAARALKDGGKLVCLVKRPKDAGDRVEVLDLLVKRFHEDSDYGSRLMDFVEGLLRRGVTTASAC